MQSTKIRQLIQLVVTSSFLLTGGLARPAGAQTGTNVTCTAIVDALGTATPETTFSFLGSAAQVISATQRPGPAFTLTEPTTINQIGAFVNNCGTIIAGVPQCPDTSPLEVQIRPALNGAPDPNVLLASFTLTHDDDPLKFSFEHAEMALRLAPGTYFALFASQGNDVGHLLDNNSQPPFYQAEVVTLGFIFEGTRTGVGALPAAVRILADCTVTASIDIKPGSSQNSVNPRSNGVIPVAILTTEAVDARRVDPASVRFGSTGTEARPSHWALEDIDLDGDLDLVLHFRTQQTGIVCSTTTAMLSAQTSNGPITGSDSVRTVGCK